MKKIYEDIKKVFESSVAFKILCAIGTLLVAMLIFYAGINVGFHKASFGNDWGQHYEENFGIGHNNPYSGPMRAFGMMDYFPNAHGASGQILKISLPNIIVQDQDKDNPEKAILINANTIINKGGVAIKDTDLKTDDFVIVIGTPDSNGIIEAKFIRVIPSPQFLQ